MGREVRMVPPDWEHPKDRAARYIPLHDGLVKHLHERAQWERGFVADHKDGWRPKDNHDRTMGADEYFGELDLADYMPPWPDEVRTHYQMYEDTTEGTPLSPPMPTPEALARWLADNNASAFGHETASYEAWLEMIRGPGWAPSGVIAGGRVTSGVEAMGAPKK